MLLKIWPGGGSSFRTRASPWGILLVFIFDTALSAATNVDQMMDFNVADDTIVLENAIFATIVGTGILTAAQFVANASGTAQDADDRIVYETDTGNLFCYRTEIAQ